MYLVLPQFLHVGKEQSAFSQLAAVAAVRVRLQLRALVFVMQPSSLEAFVPCHNIILGAYVMPPGCRHVYACLYTSAGLTSIFGCGLGLCQLLSSVLPEGPDTHCAVLAD